MLRSPFNETTHSFALSADEKEKINKRVLYVLNKFQLFQIAVGTPVNTIAALFVTFILYGKASTSSLIAWNAALLIINTINVTYAVLFKKYKVDPLNMANWRRAYHVIITTLAFIWGCVGILFTDQLVYQVFTLSFLQIAFVGFCMGTITDFKACVLSIIAILSPYIGYRLYTAILGGTTSVGYDPALNIAFSVSLLIIGAYMFLVCFAGYMLLKNFFRLNFENILLNEKLGDMNKILEKKVQERTAELESSLKLVTYQSTHDLLTDLPNQRLLFKYIRAAIKIANQNNRQFAIACFSINELSKIYDAVGYQTAELTIKTIAHRFQKLFSEQDKDPSTNYAVTLSRKDTFTILIQPVEVHQIETKIEKLFSILEEPIYVGKQQIKLTASIGVSIYPTDGHEITSLLMNADAAMLAAKTQGGNNLNIYKAEINADVTRQLEIESHLQSALKHQEFIVQYQPFVNLKTGKIVGMESLLRWKSPMLGFVSPEDFIPIAEANGMIIPLGEWVLRSACKQTKYWRDQGHNVTIAVNLSAKQLLHRNIVFAIQKIIDETEIDPNALELELTETEAFQAEAIPVLNQFKRIGFRLSIDDFGTGYSGLSNLKLFDIDKLKIDKSFVQDIVTNKDSQAIVTNTIYLAKKLQVTVLAEGVETKEQLELLRDYGCDMIQGYYFSPPVNPEDFSKLLEGADFYSKISS